ncbi:thiamine diphosphokinase [Wolbachia endosymbiont of Mansonella ozzardi]|uniref:thiamine diphosphokinase n=1 Tax=Wolbachia endosymbiont of Mansonella ozzardi TaxID=137464 RepID=UPI001CE1ED81
MPDSSFFQRDVPIIGVDGRTNRIGFHQIGVQPDLVMGDLDSVNPSLRASLNTICLPDQDYCDFSKAIARLKIMKLLTLIITGITGGAIDYILQNINIFLSTGSIFYTSAPSMVDYTLEKSITYFSLPKNTKISLLGIPRAQI